MYKPHMNSGNSKLNNQSRKSEHPWIAASKFEATEQSAVLRSILAKIKTEKAKLIQHGGKPVKVIFDLDGTVFDVKPRTLRILKEFSRTKEAREISPALCEWALGLQAHNLCYTLEESAEANAIVTDARTKDFMKAAFQFWKVRFFSDEYLLTDIPVAGAVDYAHAVIDAGAQAVYLTGRDWPGMGKGTKALLHHWGFPMAAHEAELIMKPSFTADDSEFKDAALRDLRIHSDAVAFFDNEPANFHFFERNFPEAFLVFFHSNCSQKEAKPVSKIYRIENFLY